MTNEDKKVIGQRLTTRVSNGISFIEFNYLNSHSTPDAAWIRNIYILLSFYTELQLKAIYVMSCNFTNVDDLETKLIKTGHNLELLGKHIGNNNLLRFGIEKITKTDPDYLVKTTDGEFKVEDFIDIRYDFINGKIRTLYGTEHEMFKKQIEIMYKINDILKKLVW